MVIALQATALLQENNVQLMPMTIAHGGAAVALKLCIGVYLGVSALSTTADAQTAPLAQMKAPVARQIVPMVPSLRRQVPSNFANLKSAIKRVATVGAATPKNVAGTGAKTVAPVARVALKAPIAAPAAPIGGAQTLVATPPVAAIASPAAAKVAVATAAPAPKAKVGGGTKFVAYTCKIGQDYSVARHTCFTPGVSAVAAATPRPVSARNRRIAAKAAFETSPRSALGAAKPKR